MDFSPDASSELKFEQGLKKLTNAWKLKEKELYSEKQQRLALLSQELIKLKTNSAESRKRLSFLEEQNSELHEKIRNIQVENAKLEDFKNHLMESLREDEIKQKRSSEKSVEMQGREFFLQAKSRLSYENFSVFSCYVKQLNDKSISKEMALVEVKEIFGDENADLYSTFASLLSMLD